MPVAFAPAKRTKSFLKLALTGPSGSGKTYSALLMAQGLCPGGRIAVLDTENGSAALYDTVVPFDHALIDPPYTVDKFVEGLTAAVAAKYDVLIIDSISHEWSAEGGILRQKEALDVRGGNQYANWAGPTKEHERFLGAILHAPIHVIATMRSKEGYAIGDDNKPVKMGLQPIQRDGVVYEFAIVLDVDMAHAAKSSKDRSGLFADGRIEKITTATGSRIREWLDCAVDAPTAPVMEAAPTATSVTTKPVCSGCTVELTQGQLMVSNKKFGKPLCPACQKAEAN